MTGDIFIDLALKVFAVLINALVVMGIEFLRRKLGTATYEKIKHQLETKKGLAYTAVTFVEQAYEELGGEEKYAKAAEWLAQEVTAHGLTVTPNQINGLIESAVKVMKVDAMKAA